ncbi:MAG: hypothetical protein H7196_00900 [candidate division SR1 bacterium]|nr:hypothetical protein [candidate division SR1 bacterium]
MPFFKSYMDKINFRQLSILITLIISVFNLPNIYSFSQNSFNTDTKSSLVITQTFFELKLGIFVVTPEEIYKGETIKFKQSRITFDDGSTASNLPCRITIKSPDSSVVILEGLSDTNGECLYDTSKTLSSQGLTLISGDISKINSTIGQGTAFTTITFNGNVYLSNTDSYTVKSKTLVVGDFIINPKSIYINDNLIFQLNSTKYNDGNTASALPVKLILTAPNGNEVVISGVTDNSGKFVFDLSKSLPSQGIILVSGNIKDLNNFEGNGNGSIKIVYDGVTYISKVDSYSVKSRTIPPLPFIPSPPVIIEEIPKIITNLVRTGGGIPFGIGIIIVLGGVILMVKDSLKKRKK